MNGRTKKQLKRLGNVALTFAAALAVLNLPTIWAFVSSEFLERRETYQAAAAVIETIIVGVAAIVAWLAYKAAMKTAAKQRTIELVFQDHTDGEVLANRRKFRDIKNDQRDRVSNYVLPSSEADYLRSCIVAKSLDPEAYDYKAAANQADLKTWRDEFSARRSAILAVFNRYETFAIGINEDAIDEALYKRWWKSTLISDWHAARDAVEKLRQSQGMPNLFIEFERLAQAWDAEVILDKTDS